MRCVTYLRMGALPVRPTGFEPRARSSSARRSARPPVYCAAMSDHPIDIFDRLFREAARDAGEAHRRQLARESLPRHAQGDGASWSVRRAAVETVAALAPELRPRMENWMDDEDRTGVDDVVIALVALLERVTKGESDVANGSNGRAPSSPP